MWVHRSAAREFTWSTGVALLYLLVGAYQDVTGNRGLGALVTVKYAGFAVDVAKPFRFGLIITC
jgi:hypothetical protein